MSGEETASPVAGRPPASLECSFGVVAPVASGRVPGFVVRGKQTSAWNAERLPDALASDRDLRTSRADAQAWTRLRDVHGHAGRDPDSPPEAKSPCHLAHSMCATTPCNNRW